jgi:hypothetical protein
MRAKKLFLGPVSLLLLVPFFFSCATAPKTPDPLPGSGEAYFPLPPGALVYVYADVKSSRPILDNMPIAGVDKKQSVRIFDMTRSVAAAVYPEETGTSIRAAAWGKFPVSQAGFAFTFDKNWKKIRPKTGSAYWHSDRNRLSLSLGSGQAYIALAPWGNPGSPFSDPPGTLIPDGFDEFRRGAALACWLEDPQVPINKFLNALELPLQVPAEQAFISLFPLEQDYEALIRIRTPSVSQARALVSLINMARLFISDMAESDREAALGALLFANPPVQDGQNINLRTALMSEKDIALLFSAFSIYSQERDE